jgi:hypothetical protein
MTMAKQTLGTNLKDTDRKHVLSAYVHRYTKEHCPSWAKHGGYPVQFESDQDWLNNTLFMVKNDGYLDRRYKHVESTPTWPDNPELR